MPRVDVRLVVEIEDSVTKFGLPRKNPVEFETAGLAMTLHAEGPILQRISVRVRLVVFEVGIEHCTSDIGRKIACKECVARHTLDGTVQADIAQRIDTKPELPDIGRKIEAVVRVLQLGYTQPGGCKEIMDALHPWMT